MRALSDDYLQFLKRKCGEFSKQNQKHDDPGSPISCQISSRKMFQTLDDLTLLR